MTNEKAYNLREDYVLETRISQYLYENKKRIGKRIIVNLPYADRYASEVEIGTDEKNYVRFLKLNNKEMTALLKSMSKGEVPKDLVSRIEKEGNSDTYDPGGA